MPSRAVTARLIPVAALSLGLALTGCGSSTGTASPTTAAPSQTSTTVSPPGSGTAGTAGDATPTTTTPTPTTSAAAPTGAPTADWTTYGDGTARSAAEPGAPTATALTRRWTVTVDGDVYGEPLVADGMVLVATENDTVYAFDATTGAERWKDHLATPVDGSTLPCGDINPSGITGTPVVDLASGTVWVVAFVAGPGGAQPSHHLFGLALATGTVTSNRDADAPGSVVDVEQQRGALLLDDGSVYVSYGGLAGDCGPYHGEVVGLPESGAPSTSFVTPTQREGGIWSPPGPVVGADGRIFVTTGNATSRTIYDDANAVLALSTGLKVVDLYAPSNWRQLSADDLDLSSTSPTVLADGQVVAAGKQGLSYLLSGTHLGGVGGQIATASTCPGSGMYGGTATAGSVVFLPCHDGLRAVSTSGDTLRTLWRLSGSDPGTPLLAGGALFDLAKDGTLDEVDPGSGAVHSHMSLGSTVTPFPSLSGSGAWIYAATGDHLTGVTGA